MPDAQPPIGPYQPQPPACKPYDPRAPRVAEHVAQLLRAQQPALRIEHVGSTAVPGCAGTGIVDLLLAAAPGELPGVQGLLENLGFQPPTEATPSPADWPLRVGAIEYEGTWFRVHAHLASDDSPAVEELRFFRACLRADEELTAAYVAYKKKLLKSGVTDPREYGQRKGEFIRQVLG